MSRNHQYLKSCRMEIYSAVRALCGGIWCGHGHQGNFSVEVIMSWALKKTLRITRQRIRRVIFPLLGIIFLHIYVKNNLYICILYYYIYKYIFIYYFILYISYILSYIYILLTCSFWPERAALVHVLFQTRKLEPMEVKWLA